MKELRDQLEELKRILSRIKQKHDQYEQKYKSDVVELEIKINQTEAIIKIKEGQ